MSVGIISDLTVLVVDDNRPMRKLICSLIEAFGVGGIREAADGFGAYQCMRAEPPDAVITELEMSPVDGLAFTRFVRTDPASPARDVPILMVTGSSEKRHVVAARDAGVTDFLAKPVTVRAIAERLVCAIERPRPFIRSQRFVGPDRRRRQLPMLPGARRRAGDRASRAR